MITRFAPTPSGYLHLGNAVNAQLVAWLAQEHGGTVALLHRFRRFCIATGAEHERMIERVLHIGADAVVGDHADRLHDAAAPYR